MAVFSEREVDLRAEDRQTKELKRIADRVRKIAIRDFQQAIAVIVVADQDDVRVIIGKEVAEEVIEDAEHPAYGEKEDGTVMFDPDREVSDEEAAASAE